MPDPIAASEMLITQWGPPGAIVICLAGYAVKQAKDLKESQERRVKDAQAVVAKIIELVEAHSADKAALAEAISANTTAMQLLKERLNSSHPS